MIVMILAAFQLGFIYSMLPGPVTIACGQRTVMGGWRQGGWFLLGVTLSDLVCIAVIRWGLADLMTSNLVLSLIFWVLGGGWLLKLGVDALRTPVNGGKVQSAVFVPVAPRRNLMDGAAVNLFNPLTLVGWIALGANFFATGDYSPASSTDTTLMVLLAMLTGIVVWELFIMGVVSVLRRQVNGWLIRSLSLVGGVFLIIYGLGAWVSAAQLIGQRTGA